VLKGVGDCKEFRLQRLFFVACVAAGLAISSDSAAQTAEPNSSPMDITFANTLVTQRGTEPATRWLFEPDGAYAAVDASGEIARGRWTQRDDLTCLTPDGDEETCLALVPEGAAPGQSWTTALPSSAGLSVSLLPGRD
jgi:hypothetical protein